MRSLGLTKQALECHLQAEDHQEDNEKLDELPAALHDELVHGPQNLLVRDLSEEASLHGDQDMA